MAQEDDLRALGKIMDFMRGLSVIFLLINCYWFCYEAFHSWGFTLGIVDKILMNFQRTTGLFSSILWTKLFCVVFLALSCLGTKGVKEEKITWPKIWAVLTCTEKSRQVGLLELKEVYRHLVYFRYRFTPLY